MVSSKFFLFILIVLTLSATVVIAQTQKTSGIDSVIATIPDSVKAAWRVDYTKVKAEPSYWKLSLVAYADSDMDAFAEFAGKSKHLVEMGEKTVQALQAKDTELDTGAALLCGQAFAEIDGLSASIETINVNLDATNVRVTTNEANVKSLTEAVEFVASRAKVRGGDEKFRAGLRAVLNQ